jgi:DNA-binding PadR family transcriptional regulator
VRVYRLTSAGKKQLETELTEFRRTTRAINWLIDTA